MAGLTRVQEERLIRAAAGGDRRAAEQVVKAHQGGVYAYILRLSGRSDIAEDVVQEAFIRVLTHLDRFDSRYRFSTWLFTIARRVYLNIMERRRPISDSGDMTAATIDEHTETAEDTIDLAQLTMQTRIGLEAALKQLSHDQREMIVLFHQFEWPLWLIAEQLEMPIGTVKSHLHRARLKLRELMKPAALPAARTEPAAIIVRSAPQTRPGRTGFGGRGEVRA
jgi:RNA polymerase sigma-70 factor (ECF subfamily)